MQNNELIVTYGSNISEMTMQLLEKADLKALLPNKTMKIGIKPTLVIATTPDSGATTHVEIVCSVIEYLQKYGYSNLLIIESSWLGDSTERAYKLNGYDKISAKYHVPLVDVKRDQYIKKSALGIDMEISKTALELDYLISLPVLKGHGQTLMTCALKNQKGILSDRSKRMFHSLGLDKPIAALNMLRKADFFVVDSICGDLDFEEGGTPIQSDRMFVGMDPVLVDTYGASLMGYSVNDIGHLKIAARQEIGLSDLSKANIITLNQATVSNAKPTGRARKLACYTNAQSACSACYGNLLHALKIMDDDYEDMSLFKKNNICIGQAFRGKTGCIGVGACTKDFEHTVKGCPPSANDILDMLKSL